MSTSFLGSPELGRLLSDLHLTCLDVGARGGFVPDLLPLAGAVDAIGFEPDPEECSRLNRTAAATHHPWHSLRFVPTALGLGQTPRAFNLYKERIASSFLEGNLPLAQSFSRAGYFQLDKVVPVPVMPLDAAAAAHGFEDAVYMKADIQGTESELFSSGPRLLRERMLAIRTEVCFAPLYLGQTLYHDIDHLLRELGFAPMTFVELHHWRRSTLVPPPRRIPGPVPYSRGQIIHADVLYFRDPASLPDDTPQAIEALLKAAFIALAHEFVDHALVLLRRPEVREHLLSCHGVDAERACSQVSHHLARRNRWAKWPRLCRRLLSTSAAAPGSGAA
jgi:FkbM family methyltransferase